MNSFDTPQPIDITIDLAVGDARITASDRTDTVATVRPTNESKSADVTAAEETRVDYVDGRLTVISPRSWRRFTPFDKSGSVQVSVEVPTGSTLEASTSLGDIRVEGEIDRCRVKTAMGSIRVDDVGPLALKTGYGDADVDRVRGDADIATGSGALRVGTVDGEATVKNSNGGTSIDHVTGNVRVKAANGTISIGRADASVDAKTAAGSIDVGEVRRGVAVLRTAAGSLSCGIADGTAVNLDVRSNLGRIHSSLETTSGPASTDEVVELHAHTSVGDITLFRSSGRSS
ncbi:MAG TPA: hypothetical protein VMK16_05200 [Acidimicrobiales bacterium]|nr:hypothetical protein [Acidimicrobiales bacterium]